MFRIHFSSIFLCGSLGIFAIISKIIFDKVYITSKNVVDEEFHLHLGKAYCNYDFDKWHPKVTTFPGLYLTSSLLLGAFNLCSIYWLRFTSLLFSFINVILFYCILSSNNEPRWHNIISSFNLALLPPLYFFSHLYYTDVSALTMILCLFWLNERGNHYFASIFGMFAVLFRQTNIVWVGMVAACYVLKELISIHQKKTRKPSAGPQELIHFLKNFSRDWWTILTQTSLNFWLNTICYCSLLLCFVWFVYLNGGIVVGDKTAHQATVHIPQLFYFSLFCLFFAWPHFIGEVNNFFVFIVTYKVFTVCMLLLSIVTVYFNTLVHPYMLADNRHYVFYVWNRFYGRFALFRYVVVPIYLFSWFVILKKLSDNRNVLFLLFFVPCTTVVLITQKLLEFRYFFVPFVLFRLRLKNVSANSLLCEFVTYSIINALAFYAFFTKTIEWQNFNHPQRLIW